MAKQLRTDGKFDKVWTTEARMKAVMWYLLTGSIRKAAKAAEIPYTTVQGWSKEPEWDRMLEDARRSQGARVDASLADIIKKAHEGVKERLSKGDAVVDKNGQLRFRPVSARDCMMIAAIAQDKQALVRGKPQRITASDTSLENLKKGLKKISQEEEDMKRQEEEQIVRQVLGGENEQSPGHRD